MNKLLTLLFLFGCSNEVPKVEEPKKEESPPQEQYDPKKDPNNVEYWR